MGSIFDFLPVPPGMFSAPPPKKPDPDNYTPEDRARQTEMIKGEGGKGGDMAEGEPKPEAVQPEPPARSQMQKPLAPIEAGVEECDLCGRWKSKCRMCAALFCEQCSMGEAIRMSHVRRGTVICGQCTVMMDKVPSARIVPPSIPDVNLGLSLSSEKSWKMEVLRGAMKMPTRPPPAIHLLNARGKEKEFSPEDLDNDFKYQNLFEVPPRRAACVCARGRAARVCASLCMRVRLCHLCVRYGRMRTPRSYVIVLCSPHTRSHTHTYPSR